MRSQHRDGRYDRSKQIKLKRWPSGGIVQCRNVVNAQALSALTWADNVKAGKIQLTCKGYNNYIQVLYGAIFMFAPQGRPHAIETMTTVSFMRFWEVNRMPSSTSFKTNLVYGAQVITFDGIAKDLMNVYVSSVRPMLVSMRNVRGIQAFRRGRIISTSVHLSYVLQQLCF